LPVWQGQENKTRHLGALLRDDVPLPVYCIREALDNRQQHRLIIDGKDV
jgi:hypothetical protein